MPLREPSPYPMLLEPRYLAKVWGGRRLERAFGRALPGGDSIGESWEFFDRPGGASRVRNGALRGRTLAELRGGRELPILVKILDVQDRLSVQVHPDRTTAHAHGTEAKTEAWIVLEADPGARIWRGLREETTPEAFRAAAAAGTVEGLLHSFEPKSGDVVFLQAGTVHAAGGGLLLAEVQQSSETTYRLFDWNRPPDPKSRPLHLDAGLAAARLGPAGPDRVVPREREDEENLRRLVLIATPWFSVEHITAAGVATLEIAGEDGEGADAEEAGAASDDADESRWRLLLILSGRGTLRAFDRRAEPAPFGPGDTLLLPAAHDAYEIEPSGPASVQALSFGGPDSR